MPDGSLHPGLSTGSADQFRPDPGRRRQQVPLLLLGQALAHARHREHLLDELTFELRAVSRAPSASEEDTIAHQHACGAKNQEEHYVDALQQLILASRPETLSDLLVQVMVATRSADLLRDATSPEECKLHGDAVHAVLAHAVRVLGAATGIPLASIAGTHYLPHRLAAWPEVSVADRTMERHGSNDPALDGSTWA